MNAFRRKTYTRLSKAVVIFMSALLVSTLGAAYAHVLLVEHSYCESHQAFEHADEDASSAEHDRHAQLADQLPQPPAEDPDSSDESCDWLTWMQGPSVPMPQLHASLLNLPPPAYTLAARPLAQQVYLPSPIDLLRLSPGHSPPVQSA